MDTQNSTTNPLHLSWSHDVFNQSRTTNLPAPKGPEGCLVLQPQSPDPEESFVPWDNPDNLISPEVSAVVERVVVDNLIPLLCLFGLPANVINMAAFHRQGLKERINLCLFCLALMDLLALVSMVMTYGERLVTQFLPDMPHGGPLYRFTINHYLMGLIGCSWASQYLSAIIASERCLCIVSPLRAHDLLKTRTMLIIIVVGCLLIIAPMFVINTKISFACVYNPLTNSTSLQLHPTQFYLDNRQVLDAFDGLVYGPITLGVFLGVTIVATGITSFKLRSVAAWREKSASSSSTSNLEKKEVALTKMLVATSVVYILCHLPTLTFRISYFFVTDLSLTGRYFNAFLLMSRVLFLTGTVNSSINFIVYYAMGSRFRLTVRRMFRCHVTADRRNGTSRGSSRTTVTETALGHDPKVTTISEN